MPHAHETAPVAERAEAPRRAAQISGLAVVATVAVLCLMGLLFAQFGAEIALDQRERQGIHHLVPLHRLVQALQQHRDLSNGYLAGNTSLDAPLQQARESASQRIEAAQHALPVKLTAADRWLQSRRD